MHKAYYPYQFEEDGDLYQCFQFNRFHNNLKRIRLALFKRFYEDAYCVERSSDNGTICIFGEDGVLVACAVKVAFASAFVPCVLARGVEHV